MWPEHSAHAAHAAGQLLPSCMCRMGARHKEYKERVVCSPCRGVPESHTYVGVSRCGVLRILVVVTCIVACWFVVGAVVAMWFTHPVRLIACSSRCMARLPRNPTGRGVLLRSPAGGVGMSYVRYCGVLRQPVLAAGPLTVCQKAVGGSRYCATTYVRPEAR